MNEHHRTGHHRKSPFDLTPQEKAIMGLFAGGRTRAEVSALLSIRPDILAVRLRHIKLKLDVDTLDEAIAKFKHLAN